MNREKQLQYCKICHNQSFDFKKGIICKLTNELASFENVCPNFSQDDSKTPKKKKSKLPVRIIIFTLLLVIISGGFYTYFYSPEIINKIFEKEIEKPTPIVEKGKKNGLIVKKGKNGNLISEINYKDGKKHGIAKDYYASGGIHAEINYEENIKQGDAIWYYETGEIYRITPHKDGQIDGIIKKYYENGTIKSELPYKNGNPGIGLKEYTSKGNVIETNSTLIIEGIDRLAFENKYEIKIYFKDKSYKDKFYIKVGDEKTDFLDNNFYSIPFIKKGIGSYPIYIAKGSSRMEKITFAGVKTTKLGNKLIVFKSYNLAVDNY